MLFILCWLIYGLIVGVVAKLIHPGEDKIPLLPTIGIGVLGSFIGGFISWLIGAGSHPLEPSGLLMGIVGGVIMCWIYRAYRLNRFFKTQGRMPMYRVRRKD